MKIFEIQINIIILYHPKSTHYPNIATSSILYSSEAHQFMRKSYMLFDLAIELCLMIWGENMWWCLAGAFRRRNRN